MNKHGTVLLFVNLFYLSLALPVKENTNQTLANEFYNLANSCENLLFADLIKSKMEYCNILVPVYSQKDLECIMFYEINSQLCASFGRSEVDLKANYTSKINITQNVMNLCEEAKVWKFMTPKYKSVLDKIFTSKIACLKVCTVDDVMSNDSNFFCKYFKWGSEMLSLYVNPVQQTSSNVEPTHSEIKPEMKPDTSVITNKTTISQNLKPESQQINKEQSDTSTKLVAPLKTDEMKQNDSNESALKLTASTQKTDLKGIINNVEVKSEPINLTSQSELPKPVEEQPSLKTDDNEIKQMELKPVIDNPKQKLNPELDDDLDNEFGNDLEPDDEPLSDQDNDGNELLNADPKINKEQSKEDSNINKLPITSFNMDIPQREVIFPNTIQDTFAEDDDHFFPFFLTSIVFVVLLYILYHNKSKVTKLILGLIVEGRQSNRRRNSRGHAYRRLDTLEQAMSTNSTAPPSKIIY